MMTNSQAQAYALLALRNLLSSGNLINAKVELKKILKALNGEMHYLMDCVSEEEAEERVNKIMGWN